MHITDRTDKSHATETEFCPTFQAEVRRVNLVNFKRANVTKREHEPWKDLILVVVVNVLPSVLQFLRNRATHVTWGHIANFKWTITERAIRFLHSVLRGRTGI